MIQRYTVDGYASFMVGDENGEWIMYEDYKAEKSAMCEANSNAVLGDGWRDAMEVDPPDKTLVIIFSVNHEWNICMFANGLYLGEYQEFLDVIAWMPVSELGTPAFA